ncbi:MAG: Cna B-type domain-containing protein [Ruminococcus sp.]|nr:Cna B-type domain-containing protein [Ruminococcus sp.]
MKGIINLKGVKTLSALLVIILSMAVCTTAFSAAERECSIQIVFEQENAEFDLFKVGNITGGGEAVLVDEFKDYAVDLYDENAAYTLSQYLRRDSVTPLNTAVTNEENKALFSGLEKGVYLILGHDAVYGSEKYTFLPVMISVPYWEGDVYKHDVEAMSKFEKKPVEDTTVDVSVIKVWKDSLSTEYPEISVQLLRDYEVYDTVVLSEKNSWKHTWNDLSSKYEWSVAEVKPTSIDCAVDISRDKYVFTITNTIKYPGESTPPATTAPDNTKPTSPTTPGNTTPRTTVPRTTTPRNNTTTEPVSRIPQTGQLNWPIPVLAFAGVVFIAIGALLSRKRNYE